MTSLLDQLLADINDQSNPPVDLWDPEFCGQIDIKIKKNGEWIHEGRLMTRMKLVKLFASVLKFDEGRYYLVTPVEKVEIQVEEFPFIVVGLEQVSDRWFMTNNLGEVIELTTQQKLDTEQDNCPTVIWKRNLRAKLNQNVMYQLQTYAIEHGVEENGIVKVKVGDGLIDIGPL
jgi:hypothetical protein